jgi:hypothetical protein
MDKKRHSLPITVVDITMKSGVRYGEISSQCNVHFSHSISLNVYVSPY